MTHLLWPALAATGTARVVSVSSGYQPDWRMRFTRFTTGPADLAVHEDTATG